MKSFFFTSLFVVLCINLSAQNLLAKRKPGLIKGKVTDANSKLPVEYATITVYPQGSSKPVNGIVSDQKGMFVIDGLGYGIYSVLVEFIGYNSLKIDSVTIRSESPTVS